MHDLIEAFKGVEGKYRLVIAGDADHKSDYSRALKNSAAEDERIVLTGYLTGEPLKQVFSHAGLFVLPSYHEGLPIALLEAMSYGLPVLVSDIPANKEIDLPDARYFRCGDVKDLRSKISQLLKAGLSAEEKQATSQKLKENFNWDQISDQTIAIYKKALLPKSAQSNFG